MKVSNCCGVNMVGKYIEWFILAEICPHCGEHCEYVEETTFETINTENEQRINADNRENLSTCNPRQ